MTLGTSGKTCFLLFVLLQRLNEGLPTAVQYDNDTSILFTDQGPTVHIGNGSSDLPVGTWALSDSSTGSGKPCSLLWSTSPLLS
jgi:hypothetical protein